MSLNNTICLSSLYFGDHFILRFERRRRKKKHYYSLTRIYLTPAPDWLLSVYNTYASRVLFCKESNGIDMFDKFDFFFGLVFCCHFPLLFSSLLYFFFDLPRPFFFLCLYVTLSAQRTLRQRHGTRPQTTYDYHIRVCSRY